MMGYQYLRIIKWMRVSEKIPNNEQEARVGALTEEWEDP
jgi:hypothetical protein